MRKATLFMLGFCLMALSFSAQNVKTRDESLRGPVKSITWSTYSLWQYNGEYRKFKLEHQSIAYYDRKGYEVLNLYGSLDSSKMRKITYKWDSNGNMIEEGFYHRDRLSYSKVYQYDTARNLLSIREKNPGIQLTDKEVYEYNENGQLMSHTFYFLKDSMIFSRTEYVYTKDGDRLAVGYNYEGRRTSAKRFTGYDKNGNVLREVDIKADGTIVPYDYYTYNELGQRIQHDHYWDGKMKSKTSYQYDSLGNNTNYRVVDSTGKVTSDIQYIYTYDQYQNWISRVEVSGGYHRKILERVIEYYER